MRSTCPPKSAVVVITTLLFVFSSLVVLAEEPEFTAETVVVSASRVEEDIKDTAATINTLSQQELETIKYRNPQEFLARIPGIYSHNFGGESELTSIRVPTHFTNPYTLVLIDGVPIAGYGSGSSSQISEVNLSTIERVEVVKGPASALYGSNAIGGVINLISKSPAPQPELDLNFEYGQNEQLRASALFSSGTDKLGYLLGLSCKDSKGWRDYSEYEKKSGSFKMEYAATASGLLTLKMDYLTKYGQTSGSLKEADFNENWQQTYNTFTYSEMDRFTPTVNYTQVIGEGEIEATLAYRDVQGHSIPEYSIRRQGPGIVGTKNENQENATNLQLLYNRFLDFGDSRIIVGLDAESGCNEADAYGLSIEWDPVAGKYTDYTNDGINKSFDITTQVVAPYLQWESRPTEKLKINMGGRYDFTSYSVTDKMAQTEEESEFSRATPKIGFIYNLNSKINSFITYSQGFVVPTSSQLRTSSWANKDLNPEKVDNYEFGMRSKFRDNRLHLDLAVFYMDIKDKIITRDVSRYAKEYVNAGETSHKGAEVTGLYQVNRWLSFAAAYTYAQNRFEEYISGDTDFSGNTPPRSPDNRLNFRIASAPVQGLRLELELDAVTEQYIDDANEHKYTRPTLANLRVSYDWSDWSAWVHLLNLTDRKYASYTSYSSSDGAKYFPGAPLTAFAGLAYTWGK